MGTRIRVAGVLAVIIGAVSAGALVVAAPWAERGADASFDTAVASPAFASAGPRVRFDEGHRNLHSAAGRFRPLAKLLRADGCEVRSGRGAFSAQSLGTCDVLVVVNAVGAEERDGPAFTEAECDAVQKWVEGGGALLLVADHHPSGPAAAGLARRFGVEMVGGWCDDEAHARPGSGDPGQIVFRREGAGLGDHPITRGRSAGESVAVVETFTGQSLVAPAGATALLRLSDTAVARVPVGSTAKTEGSQTITTFETEDRSAAGQCQGLALEHGKGRIVVLAEAAMLSAQVDAKTGTKFGMNAPGNDNKQFALNVVHWLARAPGLE